MPSSGQKSFNMVVEHGNDTVVEDEETRPQANNEEYTVTRVPRTALLAAEYAETLRRPWRRNTRGEDYIPDESKPPSLRGSMRPSTPPSPVAEAVSTAAGEVVDMAVNASTSSPYVAKAAGAAAKMLIGTCARRANVTASQRMSAEETAQEA